MFDRNRPPYVTSKRVKVHRARILSDKLSTLKQDELRLLRKFSRDPREPGIQQILAKPIIAEYTIQELRVAFAMLSGTAGGPAPDPLSTAGTVQMGHTSQDPFFERTSLSLISNQNTPLPSRYTPEIATKLQTMDDEELLHLTRNIGNPSDPRSRFLLIRYHLYQYRVEDIASTLATLLRLRRQQRRPERKRRLDFKSVSSPRFH
ncbi:MAG: hypothetical protein ACXACH_03025 [Candidatus Hermodarchaeia archaeon]|jgi:hypothetical protein